MSLREVKKDRTRAMIADVAFELFGRKGFTATSVEEIAAAAEVGARTVYRHFPTKEALVLGGFTKMFEAAQAALRACPEGTDVPELLRVVLESDLRMHAEYPAHLRAAAEVIGGVRSVQAQFVYIRVVHERELKQAIAARIGGLDAPFIAELAVAHVSAVFTLAFREWSESDGRIDLRDMTEKGLELLRAGKVPLPAPLSRAPAPR